MSDLTSFLARRRVALGFVVAVAAAAVARPTWGTWWMGLAVAAAGEALRVWAAGHLEKGREVTRSGPYRLMRHPLYVGSSVLAAGIVIASRSLILGVLAALYMGTTIAAAIRTEEAFLRKSFGDTYDRYARSSSMRIDEPGQAAPVDPGRRFSLSRAVRNREYRAVFGLLAGFALLALKIVLSI